MKSSALSRSFELARMAARIGWKEVRSGDIKSRLEQAAILAEGLSQMKGAAMKAGQLLSLELVDYFPKEAVEILSRLQSQATKVDFSVVDKVIRQELGSQDFARLSELDPEPIGAASIGQVHRVLIDGRPSVLKVQYPGVANSIDSDLRILKSVAKTFCALSGREMDLDPLFEEFRFILEQEVDYEREAELQSKYRNHVLKIPKTAGLKYVVPSVDQGISTSRVLAMEWQEGESLRSWIQKASSPAKRQLLAHAILNLYFQEFFNWGLVQTDPNQGNFLVREKDGDLELVLLDFGATRSYSREFIQNYIRLLEVTGRGDRQAVREQSLAFGLIDPRESDEAFEALYQVLRVAVRPFFTPEGVLTESSPFDFSDESHARLSIETSRDLSNKLKYSPPPRDLVFLHRKLGGVYAALKSLGVTMDVSAYWRLMMEKNHEHAAV